MYVKVSAMKNSITGNMKNTRYSLASYVYESKGEL
jgi:hypothetical protein